ncbi:MAG: hypothetical protein VB143_07350 [Burkholderia sp.]
MNKGTTSSSRLICATTPLQECAHAGRTEKKPALGAGLIHIRKRHGGDSSNYTQWDGAAQ